MRRLGLIIGLCAMLVLAGSVCCLAAAKPTGKVVLTVIGAITETNSDKGLELDMAMLEASAQNSTRVPTHGSARRSTPEWSSPTFSSSPAHPRTWQRS